VQGSHSNLPTAAAALADTTGQESKAVVLEPAAARSNQTASRTAAHTRQSLTHKFDIQGHEGYINVGFYPDGRPGELFITMAKEGSTIAA